MSRVFSPAFEGSCRRLCEDLEDEAREAWSNTTQADRKAIWAAAEKECIPVQFGITNDIRHRVLIKGRKLAWLCVCEAEGIYSRHDRAGR